MTFDPYFLTALGCGFAMLLASMGSAIASAHGGIYAVKAPDLKGFVPIIQAGVLAIYGLIICYFLFKKMDSAELTHAEGCKNLAAGLSVGTACLASGLGMTSFVKQLNAGVSMTPAPGAPEGTNERTPLIATSAGGDSVYDKSAFIKTVLSLIYLEAIGLYGLIVALFLVY